MEVLTTRINITNLRHILNAAEALQEAGETYKACEVLRTLARSIGEQLPAPTDGPQPPQPEPRMWKSA